MSLWVEATVGMNNLGVCPFFIVQYLFSILVWQKTLLRCQLCKNP